LNRQAVKEVYFLEFQLCKFTLGNYVSTIFSCSFGLFKPNSTFGGHIVVALHIYHKMKRLGKAYGD